MLRLRSVLLLCGLAATGLAAPAIVTAPALASPAGKAPSFGWAREITLPRNADLAEGSGVYGIGCGARGDCAAGGGYGATGTGEEAFVASQSRGAWKHRARVVRGDRQLFRLQLGRRGDGSTGGRRALAAGGADHHARRGAGQSGRLPRVDFVRQGRRLRDGRLVSGRQGPGLCADGRDADARPVAARRRDHRAQGRAAGWLGHELGRMLVRRPLRGGWLLTVLFAAGRWRDASAIKQPSNGASAEQAGPCAISCLRDGYCAVGGGLQRRQGRLHADGRDDLTTRLPASRVANGQWRRPIGRISRTGRAGSRPRAGR
jgi:hypothetical protein